jgi:Na+-translocating ferredoxin:NAD+ oxidoreductase RnfG subunit
VLTHAVWSSPTRRRIATERGHRANPRITIAVIAVASAAAVGGVTVAAASGLRSNSASAGRNARDELSHHRSGAIGPRRGAYGWGNRARNERDHSSALRGTDGVLTSVATTNGDQVAYSGHILYTFVEDSPGHVTGKGAQNFFVATPGLIGGDSTTTATAPAMPSNSYGY